MNAGQPAALPAPSDGLREPWHSVYAAAAVIYTAEADWITPATRFAAARTMTACLVLEDAETRLGRCPACGRYPSQPWPHHGRACGHCDPDGYR